ncbi:MAG: glutamine--tRNA ligase/YqeY domain fusion protein [Gammaproteobacteria bacterium]|nr:glutamine--tRNA ligase/YqeY domain fusion protein [Gammaproteobacteria bacterium]
MNELDRPTNFIKHIIEEDIKTGKHDKIVTRFPPEPNGYLHIGHAKSICLNFGIAKEFENAKCNLRFDDTNPVKENVDYVKAIQDDIKWLGFDWENRLYFASDYYQKLYEYAVDLIKQGKAYVCSLNADQMREYRGTLTEPGRESPDCNNSIEMNLELFEKMKNGEFAEGEKVLRAKIDMASPNINMRDPVIYRIKHAHHHRTGRDWLIFPMYDFTHCLSDMLEGITHSLCTLEFEDHRPLYDWYLDNLNTPCHPRQIEFARLNLTYTVLSKRKLLELVEEKFVDSWDDPRMPTLRGMRRRGYPAVAIRKFCDLIGLTKKDSCIDVALLENCVREELNETSLRRMAVLDPIKVVITNYPENEVEYLEASNHPKQPEMGKRKIPFAREIYIERDDFMEEPPKKFYRLAPGAEVRLRYGYVIKCEKVIKDSMTGKVTELHCSYDKDTKGGVTPEGKKKVKGIIHWVAINHCQRANSIKLYDRLFTVPFPTQDKDIDYKTHINPNSLSVINNAKLEINLSNAEVGDCFQFERLGYFVVTANNNGYLEFNRTISLRDSWAKV